MAGRTFITLTELRGGAVWLDVEQIIGLCEMNDDTTLVYCRDCELPTGVREGASEIMSRLREAHEAVAQQRS